MGAFRHDIEIKKGSRFYEEFQFLDDNDLPIPYVGKTLKGKIKSSLKTDASLHELTEANGGMIRLNELDGSFAMQVPADETNVTPDFGFYDVLQIDKLYPTTEIEPILEGKVTYKPQITVGA